MCGYYIQLLLHSVLKWSCQNEVGHDELLELSTTGQ